MGRTIAQKIIASHLVSGEMKQGSEIALRIDQTLTQDATGTMAYLALENIGIPRVKTERSLAYIDHNTLQCGFENADDHRYIQSVARKYGVYFSRPGNGICHQVHLERFGKPGKTLIGSDSHTPTGGGIGMLAMGAGGMDVAVAMGGGAYYISMPKMYKVNLKGKLPPWVTAKDISLEILRILSVKGGVGAIIEWGGEGIKGLTVPERATITNMGAELGATTSIFPSDEVTRDFLRAQGREQDWTPLESDPDAEYDRVIDIDLNALIPLVACPHSPDNVAPAADKKEIAVSQVCIGSCTNSSLRDMLRVAAILKGKRIADTVSSPETAAASALTGYITDPRTLGDYPEITMPDAFRVDDGGVIAPAPAEEAEQLSVERGPNIKPFPKGEKLPDSLTLPVSLKVGDNITTDHIMPAGAKVLPFRSNIPKMSEFCFGVCDEHFPERAKALGRSCVVGGANYGQGSSREHAALVPLYLGVRCVIAKSFARIHAANLINAGILPLTFDDPVDYDALREGDTLVIGNIHENIASGHLTARVNGKAIALSYPLTPRQIAILKAGGLLTYTKEANV